MSSEPVDVKSPRLFACGYPGCHASFKRRSHLERHAQTHTGIKLFKCHECSKAFGRSDHLRRHMMLVHSSIEEKASYPCSSCNSVFMSPTSLRRHIKRSHDTPYICEVCGNLFPSATSLQRHTLRQHLTAEIPFPNRTEDSNSKQCWYVCRADPMLCSAAFLSYPGLVRHIKSKHWSSSNEPQPLIHNQGQCIISNDNSQNQCIYTLPNEANVGHNENDPLLNNTIGENKDSDIDCSYRCPYPDCGRFYSSKSNVRKHIQVSHCNSKPYECHLCPKKYGYRTPYIRHMKNSHPEFQDDNVINDHCSGITTMDESHSDLTIPGTPHYPPLYVDAIPF